MEHNLFNEQMTSSQARIALLSAIEGKSKDEIERIKNAYFEIRPLIIRRELDLAAKGWFID